MVAQAAGIDYAGWAEVIRAASPITGALVGSLIALVGVIYSIRSNRLNNDARMKQELQLSKDRTEHELRQDEARMKHELNTRLRDERIRAYSHLLTVTASIKMGESERTAGMVKVAETFSEIQLLTDSKEVIDAASYIGHNYNQAAQSGANAIAKGEDPSTSIGYRVSRKALEAAVSQFLDAAKEELGVNPHAGNPSSSTDDEADRDTR